MISSDVILSFIIPAFNEEGNIEKTVELIKKHTPKEFAFEIIVINHGSSDNTAFLAQKSGAMVINKPKGTVADLRNHGSEYAAGIIYIFLDADIHLTQEWQNSITPIIQRILDGERLLTGSWVSVSENGSWIEKYWFKPQQHRVNTHINSGHMIIGRELFQEIGGFNAGLETGEDYDISMRAKSKGIVVIEEPKLKVIHEGYPKSIKEFVKREYWHGRGDGASLSTFIHSKVALTSFLFMVLHIVLIVYLLVKFNLTPIYIILSLISLICIATSVNKFKRENIYVILMNSVMYYMYFWSRGLSLISGLAFRKIKKRHR